MARITRYLDLMVSEENGLVTVRISRPSAPSEKTEIKATYDPENHPVLDKGLGDAIYEIIMKEKQQQ